MEDGGAGMLAIRKKLVAKSMTKVMMEIGGIVMMLMVVSMNVIKMIMIVAGG